MIAPTGCKTPKYDRSEYTLTKADLTFMLKRAKQINDMLGYYINMAENCTGELEARGGNADTLEELYNVISEIKHTIACVYCH